ncbi:hypothetical protein [Flavobacterium sp.]|uniref:hypothetical protein n=1 Tax=Flavobacterium sp. TaxID=239 RepID=UPI003341A6D4
MKNILKISVILIIGIVLGFFISKKISFEKPKYVILQSDYSHQELGILKKGTKLQFDEGMSEGFSRYILYLNISDSDNLKLEKSNYINEINPYWIEKKE